jgi:hypothetical protein
MVDKVVIIGGGPSLRSFDFKLLDNKFTIGLNYVCRFYEPTAIIWVDRTFYDEERQYLDCSKSVLIAKDGCKTPNNVIKLLDSRKVYYGKDGLKSGLYSSYMVGLFALSLCVALEIKEIYLLGYDCRFLDNKSHFHDVKHRGTKSEEPYIKCIDMFNVYKDCESKIYNVSEISLINVFQKMTIDDFLSDIKDYNVEQKSIKQLLIDRTKRYRIN